MAASAAPAQLRAEKALAVGVITNELVTNAFKYAFEGELPGHVRVDLTESGDDLVLSVCDNGVGQSAEGRVGLGTRLITVFAGQLGGTATWETGPSGVQGHRPFS